MSNKRLTKTFNIPPIGCIFLPVIFCASYALWHNPLQACAMMCSYIVICLVLTSLAGGSNENRN